MYFTEKHRLSFGHIYLISEHVAEVIVDNGIELTLDMAEEYHNFLLSHLRAPFAVLINRINNYSISYEAQLVIGSVTGLAAIAVVNYDTKGRNVVNRLMTVRKPDKLNLRQFCGFHFGRSECFSWLTTQIEVASISKKSNQRT